MSQEKFPRDKVLALLVEKGKTPDPECRRCGGTGARTFSNGWTVCICAFIRREDRHVVESTLAELAREQLAKLRSGGQEQ